MEKNSLGGIDAKDRKILFELETDARQSAAQIARKAGLSEDVVNYRIKKYLKSGLITKFFIIPNFDMLGLGTYRFYFQFRATSKAKENEIIDYIREKMPCQWLGVCHGQWDVIGRITARDIFEYNNLMDEFFALYGEYISRKEFTVQLRHTWWPSTYGFMEGNRKRGKLRHFVPKEVKKAKFDNLDLKIMSVMIERARLPVIEIAKEVGASPDTVHLRIKRLVKDGIITQIKSYFNREKMGYSHMQVFVNMNQDRKRIGEFISFLNLFEPCFFISSMVGAWDMQFGLDAKGSVEFNELFARIKEKFPDVIKSYETLIVYREYAPNPFVHFIGKG